MKIHPPSWVHHLAKGLHFPSLSTSVVNLKPPSLLFYSSEVAGDPSTAEVVQPDPNSYRVHRISREFDILGQPAAEGPRDYSRSAIRCRYLILTCTSNPPPSPNTCSRTQKSTALSILFNR